VEGRGVIDPRRLLRAVAVVLAVVLLPRWAHGQ
jgi:hypothetical protein